jgi:aminopeptidase
MLDPRISRLADVLVNYSCAVKPGETILIEAIDVPHEFACELIRTARAAGALPVVKLDSNQIRRAMMRGASREGWDLVADHEEGLMKRMTCYIGARGNPNVSELSDVSGDEQAIYEKTVWQRVHTQLRVKKTRWVVLRWPSPSMAQMAELSTEAFEDFYFDVCTMDYRKMSRAMQPLAERMMKTDIVRLVGPRDIRI